MASKAIDKAYLITQLKNYETSVVGAKYVAQETGKGLSSNDYTTAEKEKLAGLETYVASQIAGAGHLKRSIVTAVPSADDAEDNVIYMLKVDSATGDDKYQEYQKIDGEVKLVGDTSVDLTDYATKAETYNKTEVDTLVSNGVTFETDNIDFATEY